MNSSPWTDNDDAFMPMFDESIVVAHGGQKATIEAAVFTDNMGNALSESTLDTDREDIKIVCKSCDWPYMSQLVRGDMIERTAYNGMKYKMVEARFDTLMGWCIIARSI